MESSQIAEIASKSLACFTLGRMTYALISASGKTIDTLYKLDCDSGQIDEIGLRTLAKNSASKLPEVRQNFAWFATESSAHQALQEGAWEEEETKAQSGMPGLSFFMHGGVVVNAKTKKQKFLNDFYHLDLKQGLFRKFFLLDGAKGRAGHAICQIGNEVFLFGGTALKDVLFDDMWKFDLENVQWEEQKQADLVGLVAEKQSQSGDNPGKMAGHSLIVSGEKLILVTQNRKIYSYETQTSKWSLISAADDDESHLPVDVAFKHSIPDCICMKPPDSNTVMLFQAGCDGKMLFVDEETVDQPHLVTKYGLIDLNTFERIALFQNHESCLPEQAQSLEEVVVVEAEDSEEEQEQETPEEIALREEIESLEHELAEFQACSDENEISDEDVGLQPLKAQLAPLKEQVKTLQADLKLKTQVMTQMDKGIGLFEQQAQDERSLKEFKKQEAILLSNLIISGESLAVRIDQQVLSIVDLVDQQADLQSVLASLDPDLTSDLHYVEQEKVKHQHVLRKFLNQLSALESETSSQHQLA